MRASKKGRARPARTIKTKATATRADTPSINDEIRRLQKTQALLICIKCAADEGVEFDVADALAIIVAMIEESLAALDRLETVVRKESLL